MSNFQLSPGVVIDLNRRQAYVTGPEGNILALDLTQGIPAWSTNEVAKPLALAGNLLISQALPSGATNQLHIVALDIGEGGRPVLRKSVQLPAGVRPSVDKTGGSSFVASASAVGGNAAVSWEYSEIPRSGARPGGPESYLGRPAESSAPLPAGNSKMQSPMVRNEAAPKVKRGAFGIDLSSGNITPQVPEAVRLAPPIRTLDLPLATPLATDAEPQFLSGDGRYVLSSQRVSDDSVWEKYLWTISDRNTGERLGQIRSHLRVAPFFILDSRIIYEVGPYAKRADTGHIVEEPRQLRAVDLRTAQMAWSQPLRDATRRGPVPP